MKFAARRLLALIAVAAATRLSAQAQDAFYLKNGDRVVFYGDSITDQRLYTTFTETFVLTRFPKMTVDFVHSGWGGDRVSGGGGGPIDLRLKRDVFAYKPTVMTIMLGMNDASYRAFDQNIFDTYAKGYQNIVTTVKQNVPGIRMTLIQPSPFDDVTRAPGWDPGYNSVLVRYGQFVKELAGKEGQHVADLNTSVVEATKKAKAVDEANAVKLNPDRVHPGNGGQLLMALALIKAWNAPAIVSEVSANVGDPASVKLTNTSIAEVAHQDGKLSWTQTDAALPFPVDLKDAVVGLAVKSGDFMEAVNRQVLKLSGLTAEKYELKIDGAVVGQFTKAQLADGINLANYDTPMMKQAQEVHRLTLLHNNVHFTRWRNVQVPLDREGYDSSEAQKGLDLVEAQIVAKQRAAAQPKPHRFELSPV